MTLSLYSNYLNSAGQRVRIALGLKGIDYQYLSVRAMGWDAYEQVNPQRLMPALDVNGQIIVQATAILEYLEEEYPNTYPLLSSDPIRRALARGFAQHITSEMHAIDVIRVRRFLHNELGVDETGLDAWHEHWFDKGFNALEQQLRQRTHQWPYCFGDVPGWADVHLVPQVEKGISRFALDMSVFPLLNGVYLRCRDLPAFVQARPEHQPDFPGELVEPTLEVGQESSTGII